MPVPGLVPHLTGNVLSIAYMANVDNVDLFADIGSPAYPVHVSVLVADGVTIGAALNPGQARPDPAFHISTAFPAGSTVFLINRGRIAGGGGIGGNGDSGRRDTTSGNTFCGGGGGGGAGSTSQGGVHGPDVSTSATDGAAGTTTAGGAAGVNDTSSGESPFEQGAAAQTGGIAILCRNVNLVIDNAAGEIVAGANGGEGGYQDGGLPAGEVDPEDGDDLATAVTFSTVSGVEPEAVAHVNAFGASGYTLEWISGNTYPSVIGYVREIA